MKTRIVFTAIVLVVAVVANWIYIEVVWGSFRAYMNACLADNQKYADLYVIAKRIYNEL